MADREDLIKEFHSDKTLMQVREEYRVRTTTITDIWREEFGEDVFTERKVKNYRRSKLGSKNPMKGKNGSSHHNWLTNEDDVSRSHGYIRRRKPEWYTGPAPNGFVLGHVLVYCQREGVTEVPAGYHVHHLDSVRDNNKPTNLVLLTAADHIRLHRWLDGVQRLSRKGVG